MRIDVILCSFLFIYLFFFLKSIKNQDVTMMVYSVDSTHI